MACTAPINIVKNIDKTCDNKCKYSYLYPITNLVVSNRTKFIEFKCDPATTPVTFNAGKYNVDNFRIYSPSLHTFGGKQAIGELIISHRENTSGKTLLVCIPIQIGTAIMGNAKLLDIFVNKISKDAPGTNDTTTIRIDTFTLNNIVPNKPFYSYRGTLPYNNNNCIAEQSVDYVVFDSKDAILLSKESYIKLKDIISPSGISTKTNTKGLFYNKTGPSKDLGEGIYIECSPTGYSGETKVEQEPSTYTLSSINIKTILNSPIFLLLVGIIIMAIFLKLGHKGLTKLFGESTPTTKISNTAVQ